MFVPEDAWAPFNRRAWLRCRAPGMDDELGDRLTAGGVSIACEPYIGMMLGLHRLFADRSWFPGRCHTEREAALELGDRRIIALRGEDSMGEVLALWPDPTQMVAAAVPEIGVLRLTWEHYVNAFERGYFLSVIVFSEDLSLAYFMYEGEFGIIGRTRAETINRIVRLSHHRTPHGDIVPAERLAVGFTDGRCWESGRYGHEVDRAAMELMEHALVGATGLPVEHRQLSPWLERHSADRQ